MPDMKRSLCIPFVAALLAGCAAQPLWSPSAAQNTAQPTSRATQSSTTDSSALTVPSTQRSLAAYKIGSGDRLRIDVFGEPDLSFETTADANGTITYPLLGRLRVLGLTGKDLEQVLTEGLTQGQFLVKPEVRVNIVNFRPIYVIGQVKRAGSYPYVEGINVEKALALAGGMTDLASTRQIYILRENNQTFLREKADLSSQVFPGDTVIIEQGWF